MILRSQSLQFGSGPEGVTTISPREPIALESLVGILADNRAELMNVLQKSGVVLFRGFSVTDPVLFGSVLREGFGLDLWNSYNSRRMPDFLARKIRKYGESFVGGSDYRQYLGQDAVQLGPVDNGVQGPHVEGGIAPDRARFLGLMCVEPAPHLAETGFADLVKVYSELSTEAKNKYKAASNRFSYVVKRDIRWYDHVICTLGKYKIVQEKGKPVKLVLPPCPLVCTIPETGELTIQPWAFSRNTVDQVQRSAQASYPGRLEIDRDSTASQVHLMWELSDALGEKLDWMEDEQIELFTRIYSNSKLMTWQRGDFALVDNMRMAHWRMNGVQGNRKLVQIQANAFNANHYAVKSAN